MKGDERIVELVEEVSRLTWDVIGLCEVRRGGISCQTLYDESTLYTNGIEGFGGTGFLVHSTVSKCIRSFKAYTHRVSKLILQPLSSAGNGRLKLIQVYAPTSAASDEEMESFYTSLVEAVHEDICKYVVIMGDWNAKVGCRISASETPVGNHGFESRNERGEQMIDFCRAQRLFIVNTFFQKPKEKKWTWISPDGQIQNMIDYYVSNDLSIFKDVETSRDLDLGSDHKPLKAILVLNKYGRKQKNKRGAREL